MKVFLVGAMGPLGRHLLPALVKAGHDVVGTTRDPARAGALRMAGAEAAVLDALDREAVHAAVAAAAPDVVVHQLTALSGPLSFRRLDRTFGATNRLRTAGLDHLLDAAVAAGARRVVAQSFAGWPHGREGARVKTEDDPLDPHPIPSSRDTLAAIRHVEDAVTSRAGIEGVVLRYGGFYGPGSGLGAGGDVLALVQHRRLPVVGNGQGVWSFLHLEDAASATVAAVEGGPGVTGVLQVADDEPAPVAEWLPALAAAVGAKPPRHVPAWLVRPVLGEFGVAMMTQVRGVSNARAKAALGWEPAYASWRDGFRTGLGLP
jgi:2-alkyl-3-oxoalkanoate reductase